jgi:hypothetical protein
MIRNGENQIILKIPNIDKYIVEYRDNAIFLTVKPIEQFQTIQNENSNTSDATISTEKFLKMNLTHSKIIDCIVTNGDIEISKSKKSYLGILMDIWSSVPRDMIITNSTFNVKTEQIFKEKGYYWKDSIKLSIQYKDSKGCMQEIIHMLNLRNYNMKIKIKLSNGNIIDFAI